MRAAAAKVLEFGSVNIDVVFHACATLPEPGETVACASHSRLNGGKGANQAVACASVSGRDDGARDVDVDFVGCLSAADESFVLGALRERGVDVSKCQFASGVETGTAAVLVDTRAENCIVVSPGANASLSANVFRDAVPAPAYACALFQMETPWAETLATAELVRRPSGGAADGRERCVTFLNFSPARSETAGEVLRCAHIDCLVVNEKELNVLSRWTVENKVAEADLATMSSREAAELIAKTYNKVILLTRGASGSCVVMPPSGDNPTLTLDADALRLREEERIVDTVGAGDAFVGAFVASVASDYPLQTALSIAASAGTLACTEPGARPRAIAAARERETSVAVSAPDWWARLPNPCRYSFTNGC